jgi:hypothetical protein
MSCQHIGQKIYAILFGDSGLGSVRETRDAIGLCHLSLSCHARHAPLALISSLEFVTLFWYVVRPIRELYLGVVDMLKTNERHPRRLGLFWP